MLDSVFCVLQGLAYINKKGVYGTDLIKKRWYFPQYTDGIKIMVHFTNKDVVSVDVLHGDLENVPLQVFSMK